MMVKKAVVFTVCSLISVLAFTQNKQSEYLEAKRLFGTGSYKEARTAFAQLTDDEVFGKHASFYFGLSAYKEGEINTATGMWKQVLAKYPDWPEKGEVLFWLAYANFEGGHFAEGVRYAHQMAQETEDPEGERKLVSKYLLPLDLDQVNTLYERNSSSRALAWVLVRKLNDVAYQEKDIDRITSLIDQWDFEMDEITSFELPENVRKDTYDIAVLLPFLFESLANTSVIIQNSLVMDMYQGMLLAAEDLNSEGKPVRLLPYDTKRQEAATRDVLQSDRLKAVDLIVGPLYPGPNAAVNEFSLKYKINTINPLSSNSEVIGGNPLSYLMMPSYNTMARKTAELAATENENKYVMIFYEENARDSLFAVAYRKEIEEAGFVVVAHHGMNQENVREVVEVLSSQYEVFLSQEEADSIALIPGRFIRQRRIRTDELNRMVTDEHFKLPVSYDEDQKEIVYYENRFDLPPDSIGHVLGATRSNLYANHLIGAVQSRPDSIKLYGYADWLNFTMLSYDQLEKLGVALSYPEYRDRYKPSYRKLVDRFREKYKTNPTLNHFRGYEAIWYTGNMLHRYGKYFQEGLRDGNFYQGKAFEGHKYGGNNDNQIVPIVRFKDARLEVVNKDNYGNSEK